MAFLNIFTSTVKSKANELANLKNEEEEIQRQIRALINGLSEFWKGQSEEALLNSFNDKQATMEEILKVLQEFVDLANEAADKAVSIDHQLAGMLRAFMR